MLLYRWDQLKTLSDEVKGRFNLNECRTHQHLMDVLHVDVHAVVCRCDCWCVVVVVRFGIALVVARIWWGSIAVFWRCGKVTACFNSDMIRCVGI